MEEAQVLKLSKKERKNLKRELDKQNQLQSKRQKTFIKWGIIVLILAVLGAGGFWFFKEITKPVPGKFVEDLGRKHVPVKEWEEFKYNSNPPTSGPHDADWIKKGIYDVPQKDGYLIHSLEHGYIIISYNCMKLNSKIKSQSSKLIKKAYAHEEGDTLTIEEHAKEASDGAKLEDSVWKSKACEDLKKQLEEIANENKIWKLIVVPRPTLDVPIALTAWNRIYPMNAGANGLLSNDQVEEIKRFIDAFRDHGPEQTMEP